MLPHRRRIEDPDLGTCTWIETVSPSLNVDEVLPNAMLKPGNESRGVAAQVEALRPRETYVGDRDRYLESDKHFQL